MQITPYLTFNGNCEEAFKFYAKCLGGKIVFQISRGETPMATEVPSDTLNLIAHIHLVAGSSSLMGADACQTYTQPHGFSVNIGVETPEEAEQVFAALSENGEIRMPIEETFWALRFGMVVDQFGIPWMINCEKKM